VTNGIGGTLAQPDFAINYFKPAIATVCDSCSSLIQALDLRAARKR
jgi:hypothetical protein